jgi:hypothetical protein
MKWHKVYALFLQDLTIYYRVPARVAEFFYFPLTSLLIFGLLAVQFRGAETSAGLQAGPVLLIVQVLWNFAFLAQSTVNMQTMEDIWTGSLRQLLLTGITEWELFAARALSSSLASLMSAGVMVAVAAIWLGGAGMVEHPWAFLGLLLLSLAASLGLAAAVAGLIVMFGRQYGFLSWTVTQGFIMLSLPFVPEGLPGWLHALSVPMPFTAVFAGARELAAQGWVAPQTWAAAVITTLAYPALALPFYGWAFRRGRRSGVLAGLG